MFSSFFSFCLNRRLERARRFGGKSFAGGSLDSGVGMIGTCQEIYRHTFASARPLVGFHFELGGVKVQSGGLGSICKGQSGTHEFQPQARGLTRIPESDCVISE